MTTSTTSDEHFVPRHSLLSDKGIIHHLERGNIVIQPFDQRNLGTCSYDVCLGEYYYRERNEPSNVNTFDSRAPSQVWDGPYRARGFTSLAAGHGEGIGENDLVILSTPRAPRSWATPRSSLVAEIASRL